ncbi:hypothetical protein B7802_15740 [Salmonella enterica]|nr:hypothetical protein [Salmonella enterica]EBI4322942.1 hypothetical protein [Salmonella enterica]ECT1023179.1 hypothetical protein [Salmonella enterica]
MRQLPENTVMSLKPCFIINFLAIVLIDFQGITQKFFCFNELMLRQHSEQTLNDILMSSYSLIMLF